MSVETFGGLFALLEAPSASTITFGGVFALLDEPEPGTFTQTFGGIFALEPEPEPEASITIRVHPTGNYLVAMPLLHAIGGQLVDTVTGQPWTP